MNSTNVLEKYEAIKMAAEETKMVEDVKLVFTVEHAQEMVINAKSRALYVSPIDARVQTENDYIRFDLILVDKVNNDDQETYLLQSWSNAVTFFRAIAAKLNYKESENVIVDNIDLGVSYQDSKDKQNVVSVCITQFDLEFGSLPNIHQT